MYECKYVFWICMQVDPGTTTNEKLAGVPRLTEFRSVRLVQHQFEGPPKSGKTEQPGLVVSVQDLGVSRIRHRIQANHMHDCPTTSTRPKKMEGELEIIVLHAPPVKKCSWCQLPRPPDSALQTAFPSSTQSPWKINVQDARRLQPCQESCFLLTPLESAGVSNLRNIRGLLKSRYHLSCSQWSTNKTGKTLK